MSRKGLSEFLEHSDTGDLGSGDPVFEKLAADALFCCLQRSPNSSFISAQWPVVG
jgi:hypothetical protein